MRSSAEDKVKVLGGRYRDAAVTNTSSKQAMFGMALFLDGSVNNLTARPV